MFLADAQIVLEEADCPVLTRRDRDRCREHITELAQWAGSGAESGFKDRFKISILLAINACLSM